MTHSPPVPPGNTSPYPIHEPPHPTTTAPAAKASKSADLSKSSKLSDADGPGKWSVGKIVGAVAGVGAVAIGVAAVLFPREAEAKNKPKRKKPKG